MTEPVKCLSDHNSQPCGRLFCQHFQQLCGTFMSRGSEQIGGAKYGFMDQMRSENSAALHLAM